uniref:Putative peptidase family m13 includes neprilysin n=1 Tax=Amblyomma cajennense TaxID=34607 RepID=A0A023FUI1_AMBCJ
MILRIAVGILCVTICASEGAPDLKTEICTDSACEKLVKEIKSQMGNATPCDNFYQNVCGKWRGSLELKSKPLKEKAVKDLAYLLEAATVESTQSPNATDKLINAFQSCTQQARNKEALKASVKSVLEGYGLDQWPLQENAHTENEPTYEKILQKIGPLPLFVYSVSWDKSKPMITISKPTDFYVFDVDKDDADQTYDYQDYDTKAEEAYKEFITKTIDLLGDRATHAKQATDKHSEAADKIISVEKSFSRFASSASSETKTGKLSNIKKLLPRAFPTEILQEEFDLANVSISDGTKVEVEYLEYFEKVARFLKRNISKTQLINYFLWTKIRSMAKAVATPLNELYLEYMKKQIHL